MVSANPTGPLHRRLRPQRRARRRGRAAARARGPRRSSASTTTTTPAPRWTASAPRWRPCAAARSRPRTATTAPTSRARRASRAIRCRRCWSEIEATLERFRIHFDSWARQSELERRLPELLPRLDTYEQDGALWARSSAYGDEEDRVLIRSAEQGGTPTYRAADVAYLVDKLERGFDRAIYVLGADHHGTRNWYAAVARMLGYDPARVEVLLYQLVHLTRGGEAGEDVEAARRRRLPRRLHRRDRRRRRPLVPRQSRARPDDRDRRRPRRRASREEPRLLRPVRPCADRRDPPQRGRRRGRRVAAAARWPPEERELVKRLAELPALVPRRPSGAARRRSRPTRSASPTTSTASTTTTACSTRSERQPFRLGALPGDADGDRALPRPDRGRGARADVDAVRMRRA